VNVTEEQLSGALRLVVGLCAISGFVAGALTVILVRSLLG
jgi:hypothetical protein